MKENLNVFDFTLSSEKMNIIQKIDTGKPLVGCSQDAELADYAMTW